MIHGSLLVAYNLVIKQIDCDFALHSRYDRQDSHSTADYKFQMSDWRKRKRKKKVEFMNHSAHHFAISISSDQFNAKVLWLG